MTLHAITTNPIESCRYPPASIGRWDDSCIAHCSGHQGRSYHPQLCKNTGCLHDTNNKNSPFNNPDATKRCAHCTDSIRYADLAYYQPTNEIICWECMHTETWAPRLRPEEVAA